MSFRRIPFQFSSTDPAERQRELEKRFGLPTKSKMYVENSSPLTMGSGFRESSACSSPRLQHRVPIFVEGYDQPIRSSVDSTSSVPENKKSNVRVIPIEIEGAETLPSARHRNFSGPAGLAKESNEDFLTQRDDASPLKRSMQDLTKPSKMKATNGPKVYNIPIKFEGAGDVQKGPKSEKVKTVKKDHSKLNGCNVSKQMKDVKSVPDEQTAKPEISEEQKIDISIKNAMKKIEATLDELKSYESGVHAFSGTSKDKQYRYLDEMLTRCMLRLDDIDTMGNDKVRSARKNAVKKVQSCIDLLESKVNSSNGTEVTPAAQNEDKSNIQEKVTEGLEHEQTTGSLEQNVVAEVSEHIDKGEDSEKRQVNDVEMAEVIADAVPIDDSKVVNRTKAIKSKLSQDDSLPNSSDTKASEKLDDSNINVLHSEIPEVNDVEMVEISNAVPEVSKPVNSTEVTESLSLQDDSVCNLSKTEKSGKLDENKVNLSSEIPEVEMREASSSQETNSKSQFEVEMPECFDTPCVQASTENEVHAENSKESVLQTISQDGDVEMKEVQNTPDEIKEKTSDCDTSELEGIPDKETTVTIGVESNSNSTDGQSVMQPNCQSTTSQNNIQGD